MFGLLLIRLREQRVKVGLGEWLAFLDGLQQGLVVDLEGLYRFGRAVLVHDEKHFDAWDLAFKSTFEGVELPPQLSEALQQWLDEARAPTPGETRHWDLTPEDLREKFRKRLEEQKRRHDGGSHWIGTGGRSPFGSGGDATGGIQVGGGGGRSAVMVAGERQWADYRADRRLEARDFSVALKALRNLAREGELQLDIDGTINRTAENAGDIDLVYTRERQNRVHLVLIMDTGGSMAPHTRLVERLFTAAKDHKGFKSFKALFFHNAPYGWFYDNYESYERRPIPEVMRDWTDKHRVVFVGDASMAPYELFTPFGGNLWMGRTAGLAGLDWLKEIRRRCPASVWLNPDPERWWNHQTVRAIGGVFPMFPLTLSGLRDSVRVLRNGGGR